MGKLDEELIESLVKQYKTATKLFKTIIEGMDNLNARISALEAGKNNE